MGQITIRLPRQVQWIIQKLKEQGFEAYAVGGCVRDSILGREPEDWDITTSAKPEEIKEIFRRTVDTGIAHGTVTVLAEKEGFEVTTYRIDGEYEDGRHPKEVWFTGMLAEDLKRRDFTINAMAYNDEDGLCDLFGGQEDLARGVVRAVGEPLRRFEEDALRILRLYRFAARFGFVIDEATEAAAKQLAAHLDCVSVERIEEELNKLLSAPKPGAYLEPEVLAFVLPELPLDDLSEAREIIDALPAGAEEVTTRWAALLLPLGEDGTRKALKRLKCSNAVIDGVATLVKECGTGVRGAFSSDTIWGIPSPALLPAAAGSHPPDGPQRNSRTGLGQAPAAPDTVIRIRKLLGRYDLHTVQRLAALGAAMEPEQAADFAAQAELAAQLDADGVCCRVSQLAVNGRDLMAAGIPAGPGLRKVLEALLDAVIRGQLLNERQCLLDAAGQISAS